MNTWIAAAVVLGLASSAHCIGMCGPIALAIPSARRSWSGRLFDALLLNGGRLITYALLGALFGTFGRGLMIAGAQRTLSIVLGVIMLLIIIWPALADHTGASSLLARALSRFRSFFAQRLSRVSPAGLLTSGMLNGLLPCGSVYMALAMALVQDGYLHGASFMFMFGLGTLPALVALRVGGASFGETVRTDLRRLAPVLTGLVAVLLIMRGLGLGIPYVSPVLDSPPVGVQACE